jgi:hypothetical protein
MRLPFALFIAAMLMALAASCTPPQYTVRAAVMAHEPQRPPRCPPHRVVELKTMEAGTWEFATPADCWEA